MQLQRLLALGRAVMVCACSWLSQSL